MNKKRILILLGCVLVIILVIFLFYFLKKDNKKSEPIKDITSDIVEDITTEEITSEEIPTTETTITTIENNTTTTKKETTTKITTSKLKVVSSEKKSEESYEDFKYGTRYSVSKSWVVDTYSDGSTKIRNEKTSKVLDTSSYNASTNDLLPEATSLASSEISKINEMVSYINKYRSEATEQDIKECIEYDTTHTFVGPNGPVSADPTLNKIAMLRTLELVYSGLFSHTRPNGSSCFTAFKEVGYNSGFSGENIAAGNKTVSSTAEQWKNSRGHYCNMINGNYTKVGVGVVSLSGTKLGTYWTQVFGD